jgi:hypothetical protein
MGYSDYFFNGGHAFHDFAPSILPESFHSRFHGAFPDFLSAGVCQD